MFFSTAYSAFAFALSFMSVPSTSYQEALLNLGYKKAIDEEMTILHHNQT